MEKVINSNKLGKIFMYIASIFLIVASSVSLILLLIDRIPNLLLVFSSSSSGAGAMAYMELFTMLAPIVFVLIHLILAIVCVVKNKKHGSIKIAMTISLISSVFVLMYLFLAIYHIPASLMGSSSSGGVSGIFSRMHLLPIILPLLFAIVSSVLFSMIKRNSKKSRKPLLNKILSVALIAVTIIFLLSEVNARISDLGQGTLVKVVFILSVISLFLFLAEGVVSIIHLILNRASLHTNVNQDLECELVKEEAGYKLEKRYLEKGNKSIAPLVLSIIFVCLIGITLIWELITYISKVSSAFEFASTVSSEARLSASIIALYRSVILFFLIGIIVYFIYGATCFILGQKSKYFKLNNFLALQGLFVLFAHFVPVVYETIELMGFAIENPIILIPIITTVIFAVLSIVSLILASKAKKRMKNDERSPELMKSLAISNTLIMSASILMFIVACIFTLSLQYIPSFIGVIVLCVTLWLQIKKPREEYFLVKTELQQAEVETESEAKTETENA